MPLIGSSANAARAALEGSSEYPSDHNCLNQGIALKTPSYRSMGDIDPLLHHFWPRLSRSNSRWQSMRACLIPSPVPAPAARPRPQTLQPRLSLHGRGLLSCTPVSPLRLHAQSSNKP